MKRPESMYTEEFREWSKKRLIINIFVHTTIKLPDYGAYAGEKHYWDSRNRRYLGVGVENLRIYADRILTNALMDALPEEADPVKYCEELFERKFKGSIPSWLGMHSEYRQELQDRFLDLLNEMSEEERTDYIEKLKQSIS